jgi:hypothetical protein
MFISNPNNNVSFHDTSNGGWHCKVCDRYIHPDMIHQHNDHNHKKDKGRVKWGGSLS